MRLLEAVSLKRQFERRQRDWKPNMNVVEDAPLFRVDGYLQGYYQPHPPNETNEVTMKCFETRRWQLVVHDDDSDCDPGTPPPRPPLLGKPRPPIVDPLECGQLYCTTPHPAGWVMSEVINEMGDEFCSNPLVDRATFEPQSSTEYENSGVFWGQC